MAYYKENHYIEIVGEKRTHGASKGRNQWLFLKKFDGKRVIDFVEAAKIATRRASPGTYQEGNWSDRELDYCRKHVVLRIVEKTFGTELPAKTQWKSLARDVPLERETPARHGGGTAGALDGSEAGLYVATLIHPVPVSANAHDPRIADTSLKVNRDNCKFGKARNLNARKQNYRNTLGEHNACFSRLPVLCPRTWIGPNGWCQRGSGLTGSTDPQGASQNGWKASSQCRLSVSPCKPCGITRSTSPNFAKSVLGEEADVFGR
jgi:hypothetical protein